MTGGGYSILFGSAGGNLAALGATDDVQDSVAGGGGTITLDNAQVAVTGSDDYIWFRGPGSIAQTGEPERFVCPFAFETYGFGRAVIASAAQFHFV